MSWQHNHATGRKVQHIYLYYKGEFDNLRQESSNLDHFVVEGIESIIACVAHSVDPYRTRYTHKITISGSDCDIVNRVVDTMMESLRSRTYAKASPPSCSREFVRVFQKKI